MDPSYNGSFGGTNQAIISSETGDVILSSSDDARKSKKKLLIVFVIFLVIIIVIGLVFGLNKINSGNSSDYILAFNKFNNYIVNGVESDDVLTESYDLDTNYYFETNQDTVESRDALFSRTKTLLNDAVEVYNRLESNIPDDDGTASDNKELLSLTIKNEKDLFDLMEVIYAKDVPDYQSISSLYANGGEEKVLTEMSEYYKFDENSDNQLISDFSADFDAWIAAMLNLLSYYEANGCINDGTTDAYCMNEKGLLNGEKLVSLRDELKNTSENLDYYASLSSNFIINAFLIDALINNKDLSGLIIVDGSN